MQKNKYRYPAGTLILDESAIAAKMSLIRNQENVNYLVTNNNKKDIYGHQGPIIKSDAVIGQGLF